MSVTCTVVDGCTAAAVLQAARECSSCDAERQQLQKSADGKRRDLEDQQAREDAVKDAARRRDGQCGCGDPSSHDGSPAEKPKRAKAAADHVTAPGPCPRPQSSDFTGEEAAVLRVISERKQSLGADAERFTAAAAAVSGSHTHPMFACDKHKHRLPK